MLKLFLLFLFLTSSSYATDFKIIEITTEPAFNYFSSLIFWLLIISSPVFLVLSLLKFTRRVL